MQGNRPRDTTTELAIRRQLFRLGLRYRVDVSPLPGGRRRADVVFTRQRVAVFVDGCFWHSCPSHASRPKRNADYWGPKLAANIVRDRDTDATLRAAGWRVLRFWEHEDPVTVARSVERAVRGETDPDVSC